MANNGQINHYSQLSQLGNNCSIQVSSWSLNSLVASVNSARFIDKGISTKRFMPGFRIKLKPLKQSKNPLRNESMGCVSSIYGLNGHYIATLQICNDIHMG